MQLNIRDDSVEIEGYVNVVERRSKKLRDRFGEFIEKISKGAFKRSLEREPDVKLMVNHSREIGGVKEGNLELHEDAVGLKARATVTDPETVKDAKNGDLVGWSFGFFDRGVRKASEDGVLIRNVDDLDLKEVSILNRKRSPAYEGTLIMARDDEALLLGEEFCDGVNIRSLEREIDYSRWEQMILEMRFNPNHDAKTGRFSSKGGSGSGAVKKDTQTLVNESMQVVRDRMSNTVNPFKKEAKPNMKDIKERGKVDDAGAKQALAEAERVYADAEKAEPKITEDVINAVSAVDGEMYGLDFRLKQPTSMAGKIASDAQEEKISMRDSANGIKDAVRYTAILDDNNLVSGYNQIKSTLESQGYVEMRMKNFYNMYAEGRSDQKALQAVYQSPDGHPFEFQFHTISSQGVKELNHPLYEEWRKATTTSERRSELSTIMKNYGTYVSDPPNVSSVETHK